MKTFTRFSVACALTLFSLSGCAQQPAKSTDGKPTAAATTDEAATTRANLNKLSPEDRNLAEEQQFCAVESKNPLGSMGVPYKVMIQDQPVLLCCDACETRAKAHADRTLAKAQQLKEANAKKSSK